MGRPESKLFGAVSDPVDGSSVELCRDCDADDDRVALLFDGLSALSTSSFCTE